MGRLVPFRRRKTSKLDIDELYTRHAGMVLRRVRRFFKDPVEAEEVTHEVFLRAIEKQDSFREEASPTTWLYQMTTNYCLNRLRNADRRRRALDLNAELPWLQPSAETDAHVAVFLETFWASLDEQSMLIATYYFVDDMTHAEIARLMGVSRRTIGNRVADLQAKARAAAGRDR